MPSKEEQKKEINGRLNGLFEQVLETYDELRNHNLSRGEETMALHTMMEEYLDLPITSVAVTDSHANRLIKRTKADPIRTIRK